MNIRRAAPLNCARVCFQTVLSSAVTFNSIPKLSTAQDIGELLLAESLRDDGLSQPAINRIFRRSQGMAGSVTLALLGAAGNPEVPFLSVLIHP